MATLQLLVPMLAIAAAIAGASSGVPVARVSAMTVDDSYEYDVASDGVEDQAASNTVGEGADWFTLEFGTPRDYASPDQVTWVENLIGVPVVANGMFHGSFGSSGKLSVLYPGMGPGAIDEPFSGAQHPVDANRYRRVAFRAHVAEPARHFWWAFKEGFDKHATLVGDGWMHTGWGTYVVELSEAWSGRQQGLSLVLPEGASDLRLDWVRLLPEDDVSVVQVNWEGDRRGTVDLLVDDNRDASDGFVYEAGLGLFDDGNETWSPDVLPPGTYYTYVRRSDGGGSSGAYSPGSVVVEPMPVLRFTNPTMSSGHDYATRELGNPWDMDSAADLFKGGTWRWSWQGLKSAPTFHDGVLNARNDGRDPYFYLNVDTDRPIDTNRYRYLSWRWRVDASAHHSPGRLDDVHGLMSRFMYYGKWPYRGDSMNTGNDIVIWDGWRTYTIDLFQSHLDDGSPGSGTGWTGLKPGLRFDPLEGSRSFDFQVDWVRLTTDPEVQAGRSYPIQWSMRNVGLPADIHLHYDTDDQWENGTSGSIGRPYGGGQIPIDDPDLIYKLHLPFTRIDRSTHTFWWEVPVGLHGRFYVAAEVTNGRTTTHWYSEAPISVVP